MLSSPSTERLVLPRLSHKTLVESLGFLDDAGSSGKLSTFLKQQQEIFELGNPFLMQAVFGAVANAPAMTGTLNKVALTTLRLVNAGLQGIEDREEYAVLPMFKSDDFFARVARLMGADHRSFDRSLARENPYLAHFLDRNILTSQPTRAMIEATPALLVWLLQLELQLDRACPAEKLLAPMARAPAVV